MQSIITLLLVGLSVGMDNFGASIGIGLGGVASRLRFRIALVFGLFETIMPVIGLAIGQRAAQHLGGHANQLGGGLLVLTGLYFLLTALLKHDDKKSKVPDAAWGKLLLSGLSISIDNLIVGFGLGSRHISVVSAVIVIGLCSVSLSLLGLEIGGRIGRKLEAYSELLSGLILMGVGVAIATGLL